MVAGRSRDQSFYLTDYILTGTSTSFLECAPSWQVPKQTSFTDYTLTGKQNTALLQKSEAGGRGRTAVPFARCSPTLIHRSHFDWYRSLIPFEVNSGLTSRVNCDGVAKSFSPIAF